MPDKKPRFFTFEDFRLEAEHPCLWRKDELVSISPKALDILVLLVERDGEVVSREELLEKVWGETFVEEANINYTISLLRKALGNKSFVQTVPKRGYRFVATVGKIEEQPVIAVAEPERLVVPPPDVAGMPPRPVARRPRRWILWTTLLIAATFLTGFAFYSWQNNRAENRSFAKGRIKTLAVLPFKQLNEGETDNSLVLGLTDSLISRLGSLKRFTIRPFSAVEKYGKGKKDSLAFGRELKCDAVLVGTLQTVENHLRLNVRLLEVSDGRQIWLATFDETESDIFALQNKLATQVAGSLLEHLTQADMQLLGKEYTENPEAYHAYLRGRVIYNRRIDGGFQPVLDEYQKAISLDPTFALPYAGLADLFSRQGNGLDGVESRDAYRKAKLYAQRALELDGDLAEAHASLARIKRLADWDWAGAEVEFKRAIDLDPNNATALSWYAQMLSFLGRHDEALATVNRAIEIDPISPSISGVLFPVIEGRGEFDEGLRLAKEAYLFDKENANSRRAYATFLYHKGEYGKVIEIAEESLAKSKGASHVWVSLLAASYQKVGQADKAAEYLKRLEEEARTDSKFLYSLAVNYTELGRFDESIKALEECLEQHEERLVWVNNEPRLGDLKHDARFQAIIRKMGLV